MDAELVRKIRDYPVAFAQAVGFDLLTDIHNEWLKLMICSEKDYTLLGHRESYKTTCLSAAIADIMVLMPTKSIIFIRKTDTDVVEIIRQVDKILHNDVYSYIVEQLYGTKLEISSNAFRINTNLNYSTRGATQLQGMGIKSSITGKHADYIFTDDIVNVRDRASKSEREQIKLQYQELQNVKNRGGRIFNTATPWHKDDCVSTLMPNVHRFDCYSTGLITPEHLEALRSSMTPSLFAANYELKHIADENALFGQAIWLPANEGERIYGGRSHIDAAFDGEDYTAFTILKKESDGGYVGYGKIWRKHVDQCLDEIEALHDMYKAGSISCETNADKGYLAKELKARGFETHSYAEHQNKFIKISTILRKHWKNIRWIDDTDPEYISQILDYTEDATHDDAPDSAASLLRAMENGAKANTQAYLRGGI